MSIKLAFSTSLCPAWDLATLIRKCQLLGLQGLEISLASEDPNAWASQPLLAEPAVTRRNLEEAGLSVACLSTSIALHHTEHAAAQAAQQAAQRAIELAAALGCPIVRVLGLYIPRGESSATVIHRIGTRLAALAESASAAGIKIALQNAGNFVRAKELWMVTEVANHAGVGICWDMGHAAATGESPTVSVPTLNTRIAHVRVWDATTPTAPATPALVPLGTGEVRVKTFLDRLRGIAYDGFVSYAPPVKAGLEPAAVAADLAAAARQLRAWLNLPELGPDGKPLPPKPVEKPAAAPAAKPAAAAAKPAAGAPAAAAKPVTAAPAAPAKPAPAAAAAPAAAPAPATEAPAAPKPAE